MANARTSRRLREMANELEDLTGEMHYSGSDANGYYCSFGYFTDGDVALVELENRLRVAKEGKNK